MAGYGGQQIAQDVDLPFSPIAVESQLAQLQGQQATAQQQQSQSQLSAQTLPTNVAKAQSQLTALDLGNQSSALALAQQKQADVARTQAVNQGLIANAAALATSPEDWDRRMGALATKGVDEAGPLVGQYSEQLQSRIANAYAAPNAPSALSAMAGAGMAPGALPPVGPGGANAPGISSGAQPTDWSNQFVGKTPAELQQIGTTLQAVSAAIDRVEQSPNPAAQWAIEAPKFGYTQPVAPQDIPARLAQLKAEIEPAENAIQGIQLRASAGLGAPKALPTIDTVDGTAFKIDRSDPQNPVVTPLTPLKTKMQYVGVNPDGFGVYMNQDTGVETIGTVKLGGKPAPETAAKSPFALKQQAWLQLHPDDKQGALDFAGGKKTMSQDQMETFASAQAARDLQALSIAGTPPQDAAGYLTQQTATHMAALEGAAQPVAAGAPASAPSAPAAVTQPTQAQLAAAAASHGSKDPVGARTNPYMPLNSGQYNKLPSKAWYIFTDGRIMQKP